MSEITPLTHLGLAPQLASQMEDSKKVPQVVAPFTCQLPNRVLAEYALRRLDKPIGVSTFELTRALPADLQSSLPTAEAIEEALAGEAGVEDQ